MATDPRKPSYADADTAMSPKEKKHFLFAAIVLFGCIIILPVAGAAWILLMRWGVIGRPQ